MGGHYLIKWQNDDALGWVDLIDAALLAEKQPKTGLPHVTRFGQVFLVSTFDIELDGDGLIFSYDGDNRAANEAQGIYCGDMRIVPAKFATATELAWRDNERADWVMLPVTIKRLGSTEGVRRARCSTYVSRATELALYKRADARAKGELKCGACDFNSLSAYGEAIEQCFEVHHKHPVSQGVRVTELDDLALVCANCHNAIHGLGDLPLDDFVTRFKK